MSLYFYNTPLGNIGIEEVDGKITQILFKEEFEEDKEILEETELIKEAYNQIIKYFNGELQEFNLPLNPKGTEFRKSVWKALSSIPYGETYTYKQIAEKIGNPKAIRAVGGACNKNPIGIVIPCHRVIGSSGKLVGYAGGLDKKEKLLSLEKKKSIDKNNL